ncbi:MAG: class I SAM-dependent rRNA methyltransferase [Gammaproteobacteria bacterium]
MTAVRVTLKAGREKALLRRHPWVFSGAVQRLSADARSGDAVRVESADGRFLGWGAYSAQSQIVARIWSFDEQRPLDAALLDSLVAAALARRARTCPGARTLRLINSEADGLPGVVGDRYGECLVLQLTSAGADRWRDVIVEALARHTGLETIYERSDSDVLALEGLSPRHGPLRGDSPDTPVIVDEADLRYAVDITAGHKTGFYLDQRENRALVRTLADVPTVLDCFCYTGGFTLNALAGGARHVVSIDSSGDALALARTHTGLNGLDPARVDWIEDDVFRHLRRLRDQARSFDLVILDPPKFAPTAALAERAARGYKDINLLALKLLKPGGMLLTFSCSGGIGRELFQKIIAGAALDAGVHAQIVRTLSAAPDHPVSLAFPEGEYLKGLLVQRD